MLDPLAGPAHFEIGYLFYCESGLLPVYTTSKFTAESRTRKGERELREKERAACNLRGEESFFLSFRQHSDPSVLPPTSVCPFSSCSTNRCCIAILVAVPSAVAATGCRPFARRTGDSGAQLMEVTKVEVVLSFKVAISDSRASCACIHVNYTYVSFDSI